VLQPADIFLDRSGEEIRRRTFTLTDPSGRDLCLRPELTIPDLPAGGGSRGRKISRTHLLQRLGFPPSAGQAQPAHAILSRRA
jgi:hypothetical protein